MVCRGGGGWEGGTGDYGCGGGTRLPQGEVTSMSGQGLGLVPWSKRLAAAWADLYCLVLINLQTCPVRGWRYKHPAHILVCIFIHNARPTNNAFALTRMNKVILHCIVPSHIQQMLSFIHDVCCDIYLQSYFVLIKCRQLVHDRSFRHQDNHRNRQICSTISV